MDLETFSRDPNLVAARLDAADLFGPMTWRVTVPAECAALVWREGGALAVENGGTTVERAGVLELVVVRLRPVELTFDEPALESSDGFECSATARLAVAVVPERADLESFSQIILGASRRATAQRLTLHLRDTVARGLYHFAAATTAEALVRSRDDAAFAEQLAEALKPLLFAAGLCRSGRIGLTAASPAWETARRSHRDTEARRRQITVEQELRAAALSAQQMHVERLSSLLGQLDALARERPGVAMGDLIRTFEASQRGPLYRELLTREVSARRTAAIAVVAGRELLLFNPNDGVLLQRRAVDGPLGALRSVRPAGDGTSGLLLGAATGVYVCDAADGPMRAYPFKPPRPLRGGVNAAVLLGGALYATHSEVGVLCWDAGSSGAGRVVLAELTAGAAAVRDIQSDADGALWFTADDRVIGWSPSAPRDAQATTVPMAAAAQAGSAAQEGGAAAPDRSAAAGTLVSMGSIAGSGGRQRVESLCLGGGRVYAGTSDGRLVSWRPGDPRAIEVLMSGEAGRIESAQWMSGAGVERVLAACQRPYALMLVRGDASRLEYRAEEPIRWAAAADDWVIAVNDRRDRLYVWRPWQPEAVERTIFVGRTVGHSIQDAVLLASLPNAAADGPAV